jgi:hypothetical protein
VVAGTATAVSNRVSRRQASRWAAQDQYPNDQQPGYEPAPAPPQGPTTDDKIEQLKAIGELKASGVLTNAEFEAQKAKILAG